MKKTIWTIFTNTVGGVSALFGGITMGTTYKLYDNYNLANAEWKFYNSYNKYQDSFSDNVKTSLSSLLTTKFQNLPSNISGISLEQISNFKTFSSYLEFLKNKGESFIYSKSAFNQIKTNVSSASFISKRNSLIEVVNSELKNNYTIYHGMSFYLTNVVSKLFYFNKTPENISMIFGILFLVGGFATIMIYWSIYVMPLSSKPKENSGGSK